MKKWIFSFIILLSFAISIFGQEFTINGNRYYKKENGSSVSIYKNEDVILVVNNLKSFVVSNNESSIAYTTLENDGSMRLYKNGQLYATTKDMFINPSLSPDGNKLYYFEVKYGSNNSLLFYVRGPDIPPAISGPYLKPYGYGTFIFSNDSRYMACHVESFTPGMTGFYFFLNNRLLGPYRSTSRNFNFSDDSSQFIFTRNGSEEIINLK